MAKPRVDGPVLIAIDPGLDDLGIAVFDLGAWEAARPRLQPDTVAAVWALQRTHRLTTSPRGALASRLQQLARGVEEHVRDYGAAEVVIEMPAKEGLYRKECHNQAAVNKLYMSIAAAKIGAVNGGARVIGLKAPSVPKEVRHDILATAAGRAGVELPTQEDELDSVWVGVQYLAAPPARIGATR